MSTGQNNATSNNTDALIERTGATLKDIGFKAFIFILVFAIFTCNMLAVSISLQCNRLKDFRFKLSSAVFAFMFGFLYILINYFMYRVNLKGSACSICSDNPFPFAV